MEKINTLYNLFIHFTQTSREEYICQNPTATFLNIDAAGRGFVGDDTGAVYFEFDTIQDGIRQLEVTYR